MSHVEPVDPRVRLAIVQWPDDAPRGAVTTFCAEHSISRKTFYEIRRRTATDGPAAALEPRSRRPASSPARITDEVKDQAVQVRAALEASGLDHGPVRVHEKMRTLGMAPVPSVASLARIFRDKGVARKEPHKRPRASFRRFVYPAPNACWQLDGTEYVLTGGRKCVIFQLIDDHSRLAVASHVASGETSQGALTVVKKGITAHGVPQRLLSDNGAALNPIRRGITGQLYSYLTSLGVEPITGKPYKPTTQGKNERFHQTLFRYLDKQPIAATLAELQAQVDTFDDIYNTQRPHQGLPGRITPAAAWAATPTVEAPRPRDKPLPLPDERSGDVIRAMRVRRNGTITIRGVQFMTTSTLAEQTVWVVQEQAGMLVFDTNGTLIIEHPWPTDGVRYVGNGQPRGRHFKTDQPSPMS